jgi:hypothetical protein
VSAIQKVAPLSKRFEAIRRMPDPADGILQDHDWFDRIREARFKRQWDATGTPMGFPKVDDRLFYAPQKSVDCLGPLSFC